VDDLKISHVDLKVNDSIVEILNARYGKEAPLTVTRGKVHNYLGMKINFSQPGKVSFSMDGFVQEIINETPDNIIGRPARTPAASHLFQVDPNAPKLLEDKAKLFHTLTAKLLFLCCRVR
jgi:hypothetical protein